LLSVRGRNLDDVYPFSGSSWFLVSVIIVIIFQV
jgi:hypothetical protein